jgi:putative peptidoglycan lipid II flippase
MTDAFRAERGPDAHARPAVAMSSRMVRSAGLISAATMGSRVLGVARETALAWQFGASSGMAMDAFNVAFRIPNLLRDLFAEGAMTAAFVPTFTRTLTARGRAAAWHLGNLVINSLVLVTGVLVVIGIVFAEPITHAIASGDEFAAIPGKLELTTELTRIMLPFLTTVAVAVAIMGMLNSLHHFFIPALAPAMFNVATILSVVALVPFMPALGLAPIAGVAVGTVLGGLGQILLQWPALTRKGFRYRFVLDFKDPELREVLRLMGPGTLGLAAVQINLFVNTYLATTQPQGHLSWLQYAFRLMYLPIGLFGVSIATAALPELSRQAAAADRTAMRQTVSKGLRMMLMLNLPAMVGLVALAEPIVELLLQWGRFTPHDTVGTATALIFYAPGLLGYSAVKLASPTFYSLGDSRTPVVVSIISVLANLGMNLVLVRVMGYRGLALGTALAAILNAGTLLILLRGRLDGLEERRIIVAALKIGVASMLMGLSVWWYAAWFSALQPSESFWWRASRVFSAIGLGVGVLLGAARLLRIEEFDEALSRVIRRIRRH